MGEDELTDRPESFPPPRAEEAAPPSETSAPAEEIPAPPEEPAVSEGNGISWALIWGLVLTTAVVILAVQNTASVPVRLFFWELRAPLIIVILVTSLVVVVIDQLVGLVTRRRRSRIMREREELEQLRTQVDSGGPEVA